MRSLNTFAAIFIHNYLYNSKHKKMKIRLILICIVGYLTAYNVVAQTDTIKVSEIVISANRTPYVFSDAARTVKLISKAEILSAPVGTVADLLEQFAGVDVRQRGGSGIQADVSMKGGTFEQTLILLNGFRFNDPQTGHHSMNLPIDLNYIERIEILEGPGARIYGPNAFSGAINIVTNSEPKNELMFNATGGQFGFFDLNAALHISSSKSNHFVSGSYKQSAGYTENTDFNVGNFFYSGNFNLKTISLQVQTGYQNKQFGANSFYSAKYPNQFEHTLSNFAAVRAIYNGKIKISPAIYWRRHQDRFELYRNKEGAASWYTGHNYHLTNVLSFEVPVSFSTVAGKTNVGFDFTTEGIVSNVLGNLMNEKRKALFETEGYYTKYAERTAFNAYIDHSVRINNFMISAGGSGNYYFNSPFGLQTAFGSELAYNVGKRIKLYASGNQSFRVPTYTDLYYSGPTNVGNPTLVPETSFTAESGLNIYLNNWNVNTSVFNRWGYNLIDWGKENAALPKYTSMNLTEVQSLGFDISASYKPQPGNGKIAAIHNFTISYSYIENTKESGDYISYYVMDNLKHKFSTTLKHAIYKKMSASWTVVYQDRAGKYTNFVSNVETEYAPFWLIDGRLFYGIKNFDIYLEANNLLNTSYYDLGNVPLPGRWIKLGVSYKIKLK
ncbi:MAG TPA: hypothetical protein DCQ31_05040 [Bacteroidales bacterium]|nr:hypothetical protein [Bacteroidales bacterium]